MAAQSGTVKDTTYNGWSNYPTWAVNLWLSNDESLYRTTSRIVDEITAGYEPDQYTTENVPIRVADALKEWVRDELPIYADNGMGGAEAVAGITGFHADLLGYAFDQVDWLEVAHSWIEDIADLRES